MLQRNNFLEYGEGCCRHVFLVNMHKLVVLEERVESLSGKIFLPAFQAIEYVEPLGPWFLNVSWKFKQHKI